MVVEDILSSAAAGLQRTSLDVTAAATTIVQSGVITPRQESLSSVASATLSGSAGIEAQTINSRLGGSFVGAFSDIIRAEAAYNANVALIRTAQELSEQTVNIIA